MQQSFKTTIPPYPTISKFIPNISPPLFIYLTGFQHYYRIRSQQLTAEAFRMPRAPLRRWIAAYEHGGLAALEHPRAMADKPDKEKTQDELLQEGGDLRAEGA